ncbi:MAG TPA: tetratricopeptide repeat protein [Pyrinomonadaceae bacterium]|nr:tetratricopeptide repeat protein [Pyrinomonadaceae bacterium]
MKNLAVLFFLIIFSLTAFGQTPKTTPKKTPKPAKTVTPKFGTETEEFEKAKAIADANERIKAFQNFIKNFPESAEIPKAQGLIVAAHAELADKKIEAGDVAGGVELFKTALQETPSPVPNELFTRVILGFPLSLYSRNQRAASFDMVKLIEEKVGANASQILDLSKFFINVQYGTEAIRLAKKSTELAPDSATGFLTLAIANRLNFQLEDAANAYSKAVELDPESVTNKRSLAEMKRALGKTDEAAAIYRAMLEKNSADAFAQTGLTLTLFDGDKIKEAETELARSLEANPNNPPLLVGAAYWYAANNNGAKAVEYAQKAIEIDRSFVWSYIAEARGLLAQNKPLEAEKVLLAARQYGDFPTLDYELASARLTAGLYREAVEALKRNFVVNKEGLIETYLGNRILADAKNFTELLSLERRIALFETKAADTPENTEKLKALLEFQQKLEAADATESELVQTADEFAKGGDNMRLHRQLYAASRLLQKKTALPKVLELMQSAVGGVDAALSVPSPSAAVLADEIYESRQYAISQNLIVVVPDLPRQTLSAILRGRIEDTAGWAYFQQKDTAQSFVRLKRALSVLPEKSAWSRTSLWHLGEVLQADGKEKEALESFIKGYNKDLPDLEKRAVIENLYIKVNGNTDGLDDRIGAKPNTLPTVAATETKTAPSNTDNVKTTEPTPSPEVKTEPSPSPKTEETPQTAAEIKTEPTALPENLPTVKPEKTTEATPKTEEIKTEVKPEPAPSPTPTEVQPTPTPETKTEENKITETKPEPTPQASPTPQFVSEVKTEPSPQVSPSPENTESKTENKKPEPAPANTPKPLFEPIIISVGKTETPKTEPEVNKPTEEKPSEPVEKTESTETPKTENKTPEKPVDEKILTGENRPRIIITDNTGAKTVTEEITTCKIIVSPASLSLLNGGGSLGVEVMFENEGDLTQITAGSSSPSDVQVTLDTEIGKGSKKLFFIVKSVSTKTGVFSVTFEAPCGKKEILVKVR